MPLPEEEIGRAAHDFASFLGAPTVYLTRASKVDGVPMVASRWLQRLQALLRGMNSDALLQPREPWLAWGRARNAAGAKPIARPPAPCPPVSMRPRQASVSEIETWIANPYAIFARRVLRLDVLPHLGAEPGPQERGQIIHETLSRFTRNHPTALPSQIADEFMAIANEVVREMTGVPRVAAYWLPRLERFAQWFAETEPERRKGVERIVAEVSGSHVLGAAARPFTLTARADRIDIAGGVATITDYKTGQPPTDAAVRANLAPQLPLEAALLAEGAFEHLDRTPVHKIRYIRASGGEPPGEEREIKPKGATIPDLAADALKGVASLVADYDAPTQPYRAVRRPQFKYDYDDYEHLARVAEWAGSSDSEDGE